MAAAATDGEPDGELFLFGLLCSVLIPWLLIKLRRLVFASAPPSDVKAWQQLGFSSTSPVVLKAKALRSTWPSRATRGNAIFAVLLGSASLLAYRQHDMRQTAHSVFDPHSVLGIPESASNVEIKAAYRRLALENHPDKNPSKEAHFRFVEITKAHAVLTDADAAENFRRYGNADGYQGMQYGIGLPAWMMGEAGMVIALLLTVGLPLIALRFTRSDTKIRQGQLLGRAAAMVYSDAAAPLIEAATAPPTRPFGGNAPPPRKFSTEAVSAAKLLGLCATAFAQLDFIGGMSDEQRRALQAIRPLSKATGSSASKGEATGEGDSTAGEGGKSKAGAKKRKGSKKAGKAQGHEADGADETVDEAEGEAPPTGAGGSTGASGGAPAPPVGADAAREWMLGAHLAQRAVPDCLREEHERLLMHAPAVCEAFFACAMQLGQVLPFGEGARPILRLAQHLCQALPTEEGERAGQGVGLSDPSPGHSPWSLMQVPHFDKRLAQLAASRLGEGSKGEGSKGEAAVRGVADLVGLDAAARLTLLKSLGLGASEAAEAGAFCEHVFPRASVTGRHGVKGEDASSGVVAYDLLTIYPTLRLLHRHPSSSKTPRSPGPLPNDSCHAPLFPYAKPEGWCLLIVNPTSGVVYGIAAPPRSFADWKPRAHAKKPKDGDDGGIEWTGEVRLRVPADWSGRTVKLEMHAMCSAYLGADVSATIEIKVLSKQQALDKAKQQEEEEEEDDDDDDDDDDDESGEETPDEIDFTEHD